MTVDITFNETSSFTRLPSFSLDVQHLIRRHEARTAGEKMVGLGPMPDCETDVAIGGGVEAAGTVAVGERGAPKSMVPPAPVRRQITATSPHHRLIPLRDLFAASLGAGPYAAAGKPAQQPTDIFAIEGVVTRTFPPAVVSFASARCRHCSRPQQQYQEGWSCGTCGVVKGGQDWSYGIVMDVSDGTAEVSVVVAGKHAQNFFQGLPVSSDKDRVAVDGDLMQHFVGRWLSGMRSSSQ